MPNRKRTLVEALADEALIKWRNQLTYMQTMRDMKKPAVFSNPDAIDRIDLPVGKRQRLEDVEAEVERRGLDKTHGHNLR
jgi:hypothetical protein